MGIETTPTARPETEKSEMERGEKDIQGELSVINKQLDSTPEEVSRKYSDDRFGEIITTVRQDQGLEVAPSTERTTQEARGFEEYKSLLEQKGALIEERNAFYEKDPVALKARLKEIVKTSLRENLATDQQERDDFMKWSSEGSGVGPRMTRPKEGSPNEREFQDLQRIWDETHPWEKTESYDTSYLDEAEAEIYEEMQRQPQAVTAPAFQERVSPQTAEFMTNHILDKDLAYQDAELPDEQKEQMLNWSRSSESAKKYAESIANASTVGGLETVRNTARQMRDTMMSEATRLGIPISPHGKSTSWAMWDTGKQYHFFTHQEESGQGYEIGNPLESGSKREEIVNRHLGWEAYAAFQNNPEYRASVTGNPEYTDALELFNKAPKSTNGTLSSKDLAELGKALRRKQ